MAVKDVSVVCIQFNNNLHRKCSTISMIKFCLDNVFCKIGMCVEEVMAMHYAVLASSHKYAACNLLDGTSFEVVPVMLVQIKQVGRRGDVSLSLILRTE